MATAQKPDEQQPGTSVAVRQKRELAPEVQQRIEAVKARNQMVTAIRGTMWGKDLNADAQRAVAEYCRQNNLDPVRHVEILGGRIYLTAELYDEKGAAMIRAGLIIPAEPDVIHADERLEKMAEAGDAWAKEERDRRIRLRIKHGVPEAARGAVIQRFKIASSGAEILGVNWCGGVRPKTQYGKDADPIGEAEPTKTATTRARRRAWKQIADIIPDYANAIRPIEETARVLSEQLPIAVVERQPEVKAIAPASHEDPYETATPTPPAQHSDDPAGRAEDHEDQIEI